MKLLHCLFSVIFPPDLEMIYCWFQCLFSRENSVNFLWKRLFWKEKKIMPSCIMLPKMSAYSRDFDETKWISFLTNDNKLLEKCNEIWDKISNVIKKGSDSDPVYNEKYLKTNKILWRISQYNFFIMMKCQKNVIILFASQSGIDWFCF